MAEDPFGDDTFRMISLSQMRVSRAYRSSCLGCGHRMHDAGDCDIRPTYSLDPNERCLCPDYQIAVTDRHVIGERGR